MRLTNSLPPIKGFYETSFIDWPGRLTSVVFLPGCNFRCPYCHNGKLVLEPESFETWPIELVLEKMGEFRGWLDGVCVTGGEPTIHPGLPDLLALFRDEGWPVKLDTNGSRPEVLARLIEQGLLEAVALDVKAPLEPVPYRRNAGQGSDPEAVRQTLQVLAASGLPVHVRTTVHPHLLSLEECLRLAAQVRDLLPRARFSLQRARNENVLEPSLGERSPLGPEEFGEWERRVGDVFSGAPVSC